MMTPRMTRLAAIMVLALSLGGCSRKAVEILEPEPGTAPFNPDDRGNSAYQNYADGVHRFVVKFHADFKPETFRAELDGVDITARFEPAPAPGGISRARAPDIFSQGTPYGSGVVISAPQAPAASLARTGETAGMMHKLVVHGEISSTAGVLFFDHDVVNFMPPQPNFKPDFLRLQRGGMLPQVEVFLENPPSAGPLAVTITPMVVTTATGTTPASSTPNNRAVALNGQPPGAPITITFMPGEKLKTFSVSGVAPGGSFSLFATANGCQVSAVSGYVS
jgi:hypothetical protein